jgi:hypothetical protein
LGPFPLSLHRAVMAATIKGRRRSSEPARLPSPPSLRSYLSTHLIACASLCLPSTPTRLLEPNSPAPPPRISAAAVQTSPSVKDPLRCPSHFLFGFARGSSSSIGCRFPSSEPVGAAPRPRRSAARPAAVAKPRRC